MPPVTSGSRKPEAPATPPPAAPPAAPAPTAKVTPVAVAIEVPMAHVTGAGGQRPYSQTRIDVSLKGEEVEAFRDLYDGLVANNVFGSHKPSQGDAVRWVLRQLHKEFKKARTKA